MAARSRGTRGILKAIVDTSVLIGGQELPPGVEVSISAVSISELHFGIHAATNEAQRLQRVALMGFVEARFPRPLPLDSQVARILGRLKAVVVQRGGQPRRRIADLAIAATAASHGAVLITANPKDLKLVRDLVTVRVLATPSD